MKNLPSKVSIAEVMVKLESLYELSDTKFTNIDKNLSGLIKENQKNTEFRLLHVGAYKIIGVFGAILVGVISIWKSVFNG